ncbi:MAG TPA: glycosyltransferase family 9 protein [Anaerolineae bacterium]|nr:glycosyltransferase family 9 protein [Anaerolineae bacterium]
MSGATLPPNAKILVVKLADLGDVLTATPALRALRRRYPHAEIDVLLTRHTVAALAHFSAVDNLIPSDNFRFFALRDALKPALAAEAWRTLRRIRQKKYDAVVILHHLTTRAGAAKYAAIARASRAKIVAGLRPPGNRGRFLTHSAPDGGFGFRHEIDYWLAVVGLLGAASDDREMAMAVSPADETWAAETVRTIAGNRPLAVIHPGSGGFSTGRRWAAENFAAVADALIERGLAVALVGTAGDGTDAVRAAMAGNPIDLTGKTTLHQLAALLRRAALFIGGDSGVTHLAAASSVPLVSIFGPTNAAAWGARGAKRVVLRADIPCAPCAYVEHSVGLRHGCAAKTCLKLITPAQVTRAAFALLEGESPAAEPRPTAVAIAFPPPTFWAYDCTPSPPPMCWRRLSDSSLPERRIKFARSIPNLWWRHSAIWFSGKSSTAPRWHLPMARGC